MNRLGILISGRGSNFEAIAENIASRRLAAEIAIVISNREDARGLQIARDRGIPAVAIPSRGLTRAAHDRLVLDELTRRGVELVCLAGYMRLLTPEFIHEWQFRI